jgi:hypothetical protein
VSAPSDALAQATLWAHAANIQGLRVLSDAAWPSSGAMTKQGDAYLFVVALRDFRRAAKFVGDCLTDANAKSTVATGLSTFDKSLPEATDLRNILEHLDEYAMGKGFLRKSGGQAWPVVIWYEQTTDDYLLWLGLDGRTFKVSVRESLDAIVQLREVLIDSVS